ncbi:MAG TPA: energy transducer TonB [Gemmatimonadaceae bacterium]|jgi:protein TonB|nr:energy transducer TonB [Gemmatimonadaceae bacterium]
MFNNLIESKPQRKGGIGGTFVSVVLHVIIITLAVYVTAHAGQKVVEKNRQEDVTFAKAPEPPPPPPDEPKPPPPDVVAAPPPPKGFQVLTAPINIPDKIPDVDLSKAVTDEKDFSGKGVAGGKANGVVGGVAQTDQPYFEFQVEKPALPREGNPNPKYPSMLESSRVEGEVLAQFVVDTMGKADMSTYKVLQASNDLFASSLKTTLPQWRFYPAEAGGHKVKQIVQLPLKFVAPNH